MSSVQTTGKLEYKYQKSISFLRVTKKQNKTQFSWYTVLCLKHPTALSFTENNYSGQYMLIVKASGDMQKKKKILGGGGKNYIYQFKLHGLQTWQKRK